MHVKSSTRIAVDEIGPKLIEIANSKKFGGKTIFEIVKFKVYFIFDEYSLKIVFLINSFKLLHS